MRDVSDVIGRLSADIAANHVSDLYRSAAAATGGIPVDDDVGGIIVVTPDGSVVTRGLDDDAFHPALERDRLLALALAARRFPELSDLRPSRPAGARTCDLCGGSGRIEAVDGGCGRCSTLGWVTT